MEMYSIKLQENGKNSLSGTEEIEKHSMSSTASAIDLHIPKRILHFSDGVLEEYSDDEIGEKNNNNNMRHDAAIFQQQQVDESTLPWGPWLAAKAWRTGSTILSACDYLGEGLANFLGITTPKYASEIEEFKRIQKENDIIKKEEEEQYATWQEKSYLNDAPVTKEI